MPAAPALRIPRRSGPHRVAAIALYRALLTQCQKLQIEQAPHDELQNLMRNRFKQARKDLSTSKLRISFEAGYEAVDLLDNAVAGNVESKSRILQLLEDAPLKARQPPPLPSAPANKHQKAGKESRKGTTAVARPEQSLFDRPLPLSELSGKRHVPVLISANQIPMLRIKKPIPEHLSGYLAHRLKTRQKRRDRMDRLEAELNLAEREDDWDDLVARVEQKGRGSGIAKAMAAGSEPSWCDAIEDEIDVVHRLWKEEKRKNREMAEKMQDVVDRETALFEQEKAERKELRAKRLWDHSASDMVQSP